MIQIESGNLNQFRKIFSDADVVPSDSRVHYQVTFAVYKLKHIANMIGTNSTDLYSIMGQIFVAIIARASTILEL